MVENKVAEWLKEDMVQMIKVLNFENIRVQKEIIDKQFSILQSLQELSALKEQHNIVSQVTALNMKVEDAEAECRAVDIEENQSEGISSDLVIQEELEERPMYRFERKLRGGFLPEINGFVPEGIVRKLGIEHGDYLYATLMRDEEENNRHFHYEIAKKGDEKDAPERVQVNYCVVKKEAGYLVVDKSEETGEFIRYEDNLYTVVLDEQEIREFGVEEGSLIDIAFYKGKPQTAKIIWNHKVEDYPTPATESPSAHCYSVKGSKEGKKNKEEKETFERTLEGKSVLVIGNEPKKNLYKFAVEQRGGTFLWADAKEKLVRLEGLVKKSDLVIFLLKVSGHVGMEQIKQMCKEYNVPFETTWSNGQTNLIRIAEQVDMYQSNTTIA